MYNIAQHTATQLHLSSTPRSLDSPGTSETLRQGQGAATPSSELKQQRLGRVKSVAAETNDKRATTPGSSGTEDARKFFDGSIAASPRSPAPSVISRGDRSGGSSPKPGSPEWSGRSASMWRRGPGGRSPMRCEGGFCHFDILKAYSVTRNSSYVELEHGMRYLIAASVSCCPQNSNTGRALNIHCNASIRFVAHMNVKLFLVPIIGFASVGNICLRGLAPICYCPRH